MEDTNNVVEPVQEGGNGIPEGMPEVSEPVVIDEARDDSAGM